MAISGLGSGLDINAIVKAMVNAERAPKTLQLDRLEKSTTARFSGLAQFRSALSDFQQALDRLNNPELFEKRSATSGKTDVFSVSADQTASSGNYSVQVFNLAQTSKVALQGVASPSASVGTGTLTINVGDTEVDVLVEEGKDSLSAIRDAINVAGKESGLSASIVSDPSGAGGSRLILSSTQAGDGKDIRVSVSTDAEDTGDLSVLAFTPPAPDANYTPGAVDPDNPLAPRVISYARDANLAIDGIAIRSPGNTVENAIEGVTLTLKSAQSAEDLASANSISLSVAEDRAGVKSQIKAFVDAYNKLNETVASLTSVTSVGGDSGRPVTGALVGDATVRTFMSGLRNQLVAPTAGSEGVRILADLGVTTQKDGSLKIDDARLDKALDDNFAQVSGFLTGDQGLMSRLDSVAKPLTETGGVLDSRTKALQTTLRGVDQQREDLARRVTQLEARLFAQFNAMDQLVGQLSQTSQYLEGQLANLPGVVRQDRRR